LDVRPALAEETSFLGLLYHRPRARIGARSIPAPAAGFAIVQGREPRTPVPMLALGIGTAPRVERHHSLVPAMGVSFVKNAVALSLAAIS